jgi:hypothetical protein
MSDTKKYYFFSDFDLKLEPPCIKQDELSIESISNLTTENKVIEPLNEFSSLLVKILGKEQYSKAISENQEIVNSLIFVHVFEFFDQTKDEKDYRIIAISNQFLLYEFDFDSSTFVSDEISFSKMPDFFTYNNKLYANDHSGTFIVFEENSFPLIVTSMPMIKKVINFKNLIVFLTDNNPYNVYYAVDKSELENLTTNLDYFSTLNVDSSNGEIIDILVFKNELYVIQDYAILRFVNNTALSKLCSFCSINAKIVSKTIQSNDDYLIFMTSDGLYIFDGNDIKKIFCDETKTISGMPFKAVTFNNKYYLLLKSNFSGENSCSNLVEFDIQNSKCNIFNLNKIDDMFVLKSSKFYMLNIIKCLENQEKMFTLDKNIISTSEKHIKFNPMAFNNSYEKVLSHLKISGIGNYKISIKTDMGDFSFKCSGNLDIKNIGLKGNVFQIEISSYEEFRINSILILISNLEE